MRNWTSFGETILHTNKRKFDVNTFKSSDVWEMGIAV